MFLAHTAWRNFGSFWLTGFLFNQNATCLGLSCICLSLWILYGDFMKLQNFRDKYLAILFLHSCSCASNGCCKWYHYCQPLSWRCFLSQEIVPFNSESKLREECDLSLVSEHLYAFFVSKITTSWWLMLSKLNSLTGTTPMCRPVLAFLKDLCQAQKCYTFFCSVCDHACHGEQVCVLDPTWSFTD